LTHNRSINLALGDVNGDTHLDLVTANAGSGANNVSVLLGNGDGTFAAQTLYGTGSLPLSVALGDVNGDGRLDIVTANYDANNASVLLGNGNGTFAPQTLYTTGTGPFSVALGDVNADGRPDIVTANRFGNNASVLLGNGNGTFAPKTDYPAGSIPRSVALGDVNGDRKPDIVTANYGGSNASVLLNTTALALSRNGDTLHITPPPASSTGEVLRYQLQYTTQQRLDTGQRWGIWASPWPADKLAINLADAQTITGCLTLAADPATRCYRAIGEQTPGTTFIYRLTARYTPTTGPDANTPFTPLTTITRPN
jgi:hypothetical protein